MAQPTAPSSLSQDPRRQRAALDAARTEREIERLRAEVARLEQHVAEAQWFLSALDQYASGDAVSQAPRDAAATAEARAASEASRSGDDAAELHKPRALLTREWTDWVANVARRAGVSRSRNDAAVVIRAMCRCLHTLKLGTDVGDESAAEWAAEEVPEPWRTTVVRSRRWRSDPTPDDRATLDAQRFVAWVADQAGARGSS